MIGHKAFREEQAKGKEILAGTVTKKVVHQFFFWKLFTKKKREAHFTEMDGQEDRPTTLLFLCEVRTTLDLEMNQIDLFASFSTLNVVISFSANPLCMRQEANTTGLQLVVQSLSAATVVRKMSKQYRLPSLHPSIARQESPCFNLATWVAQTRPYSPHKKVRTDLALPCEPDKHQRRAA